MVAASERNDLTIPGGMGGKEAVKKLLEIDPGAKVIVSSGYAADPVTANYEKYGFSAVILPSLIALHRLKRCFKVYWVKTSNSRLLAKVTI